jgi:hypothetical protein
VFAASFFQAQRQALTSHVISAQDVVRGQRSSGCCPTPEAAVDQVAFMVAHVVCF